MRRMRVTGGVLIAVACAALTACGSSGGKTASDAPSQPDLASTTTTTPAQGCIKKLEGGAKIDDCQTPPANTPTTKPSPAAADAIAKFALTASIDAAQKTYDDTYDYTAVTPERLAGAVPSVRYAPLEQAAAGVVGVLAQDKHDVLLVTKSGSGQWFCVTANNEDGVSYGTAASLDKLNSNGECQLDAWPPPA